MSVPFMEDSIRQAVKDRNWYAALALALTMPDICGNIKYPGPSKDRYIKWFDDYVLKRYQSNVGASMRLKTWLSGYECYLIRCRMLHQGTEIIDQKATVDIIKRFKFTSSDCHLIQIGDTLVINAGKFAIDICDSVREYIGSISKCPEEWKKMDDMIYISLETRVGDALID